MGTAWAGCLCRGALQKEIPRLFYPHSLCMCSSCFKWWSLVRSFLTPPLAQISVSRHTGHWLILWSCSFHWWLEPPHLLLYASWAFTETEDLGSPKPSWFKESIDQQQLRHQCVISIILLLHSRHSSVPATRKITAKMNSIPPNSTFGWEFRAGDLRLLQIQLLRLRKES